MGIQGLTKLLSDKAPGCIKETEMKSYFGRTIAIDASMSIYQFLIAMKMANESGVAELSNAEGMVTSHLQGMWSRTLRMLGEGMKPVYVFDGAPPEMKRKELEERKAKAAEAQEELKRAVDEGDAELIEKMSKRTVRVSKEQTEECKKLLQLMGIPCVDALTEAEAQCAELVRVGKAWAVGTEDMDALTFGAKILLRHLSYSEAKKQPILEFHIKAVLESLEMTQDQFVDLCILLGCDYCGRIPGIGPVRAYEAIKKHKTIEKFIESLDPKKYPLPDPYPYAEARKLFKEPEVHPGEGLRVAFKDPDEEGLIKFLVDEKKFNKERVEGGIAKLKKARQAKEQTRLDQFFKITPASTAARNKRKLEEAKMAKTKESSAKLQKGKGGKKAVKR
eukprot:TRINITY_DN15262_c0_g1_i1.p1 TRINITY_DN15262_c0_g1~~TRINITY_DN15262_c0_g1_i1.p1  ORF type:complete len:406 (+),score=136.31 TRINITY_DN15262_c0_g1_i1:46-1218(+)